jgi:hypothetical protein
MASNPLSNLFSSEQLQFIKQFSKQTGLNQQVVAAWVHAEEPAESTNAGHGNNNWLNIGITGSANYGANDAVWNSPITAANATAAWLKGQASVPGYGTASAGIRGILASASLPAADQVKAIQASGWAASGYPALAQDYGQLGGQAATDLANAAGNSGVGGAINSAVSAVPDAISWVFSNWLRIFEFISGVACVIFGLVLLTKAGMAEE